MNKIVVFRPACKAVVQGPAGLATGRRGKRRLQMRLASEITRSPASQLSPSMTRFFSNLLGWSSKEGTTVGTGDFRIEIDSMGR